MKYRTKLKIWKWIWGIMCIICMALIPLGLSPLVVKEWEPATVSFSIIFGLYSGGAFFYYWSTEKGY